MWWQPFIESWSRATDEQCSITSWALLKFCCSVLLPDNKQIKATVGVALEKLTVLVTYFLFVLFLLAKKSRKVILGLSLINFRTKSDTFVSFEIDLHCLEKWPVTAFLIVWCETLQTMIWRRAQVRLRPTLMLFLSSLHWREDSFWKQKWVVLETEMSLWSRESTS